MGERIAFALATAFLVVACSSSSNSKQGSSTNNPITSVTSACGYDPSVANADGGRDTCTPHRVLVNCTSTDANGGTFSETCTSESDVTCSYDTTQSCTDQCQENEYVVECGGIGPGPVPDAPSGCRSVGANPGGIAYDCCPCQ
ncbi:MAG TPA: hypothetical protein VF407_16000 [Polyangiaceae bacterium]